jgi:aarF domain-containing kinase
MTGKQLVDAMYVLKASRSVLAKHIALRRRQLDIYSKTSSLAKAVKNQTHRFPLTAKAVSSLADRLGDPSGPDKSPQTALRHTPIQNLSPESSEETDSSKKNRSGREPGHVYGKSGAKSTTDHPLAGEGLDILKENVLQHPLSDGSNLSVNNEVSSPDRGRDTYSERSPVEPQNNPLADIDGKIDDSLRPTSTSRTSILNPESYKSFTEADRARNLQRLAEKQIPSISAEAPTSSKLQTASSDPKNKEIRINEQQDIFFTRPTDTNPVLSSLPRVKLPNFTANTQDESEHPGDTEINQDVFYSASRAEKSVPDVQTLPEHGQPSDAMYSEIFHSPKVARLLKGEKKKNGSGDGLSLGKTQDLHVEKKKVPHEKDEESFGVRSIGKVDFGPTAPFTIPETVDLLEKNKADDARHLAEEVVENVTPLSSTVAEVSSESLFLRNE